MKKWLLLSLFVLFTGVSFAEDLCTCLCNPLIEILITKQPPLTRENIAFGFPIYTHKIENGSPTGPVHLATYILGDVETDVVKKENGAWNIWSKQTVRFFNKKGERIESSFSTNWSVERINGKKFVVHYHDGFRVYSNKDSQFVISN